MIFVFYFRLYILYFGEKFRFYNFLLFFLLLNYFHSLSKLFETISITLFCWNAQTWLYYWVFIVWFWFVFVKSDQYYVIVVASVSYEMHIINLRFIWLVKEVTSIRRLIVLYFLDTEKGIFTFIRSNWHSDYRFFFLNCLWSTYYFYLANFHSESLRKYILFLATCKS